MATSFTTLPIIDLAPLGAPHPSDADLQQLSDQLSNVFETVGFAYLINPPLSFGHEEVFGMAEEFFGMPEETKMALAKRTFRKANKNTYRGYFPAQPGEDSQNLKAGFEVGPPQRLPASSKPSNSPFVLTERNVWPADGAFAARERVETLYSELQSLGTTLLALLAAALGKSPAAFTSILRNSVSTLRMLHYPRPGTAQELSCTPHTDSGLLTLLHQDAVGGLEVQSADGAWVAAPYVPGSLVVNIGDLMARMSAGRYVATLHRVRSGAAARYSVPFFCEPGVDAMVGEPGSEVRYEEFVLAKMGTWVEFQDAMEDAEHLSMASSLSAASGAGVQVAAS